MIFGAANIVKNSDVEKYLYSGYGIVFYGKGEWNCDKDYARNVITFCIDNTSSCHADNRKNNFLISGEGDTFGIDESFGALAKKLSINFRKANTKFCLSLHYNANNIYLLVDGKRIFKFKADNKNVSFPIKFCFRSISLIDLVLLSLEKYLQMGICMIFHSITILLVNLIC